MKRKAFGTYEIADICHVTPATVGHWIDKGLIPTFRTGGGHRRVWAEDLARFLKEHNIPTPEDLREMLPLSFLVVDDEEHIRKVIRRVLQKMYPHAEIDETGDGFEAGHKIAGKVPSLVILDIRLPGVDGYRVCEIIRSDPGLKSVKVLAISGHEQDETSRKSLLAGADAFLAKPFDAKQLREAVAALVADYPQAAPALPSAGA